MAKGGAPAPGSDNRVNTVDGFQFDHGLDGPIFVTPREQGIIWSCWDYCGKVSEGAEWAETILRDKENGLIFTRFGCLG